MEGILHEAMEIMDTLPSFISPWERELEWVEGCPEKDENNEGVFKTSSIELCIIKFRKYLLYHHWP